MAKTIKRISHIGIAVNNIEEAIKLWVNMFGLEAKEIETVDQELRIAIIAVGGSKIELLESTNPEGVIAKYIKRRGEGLHHLALEVSNIQKALEILRNKGVPLIDEKPRPGAENTKIAFLHPRETKILIELVEPARKRER